MPVPATLERDPATVGPLGGLLLGHVRAASPMLVVRALRWYRDLAKLGLYLPFFMVHDIGLLYAAPREQLEIGARAGADAAVERTPRVGDVLATDRARVSEIAPSEASMRARRVRLGDDPPSSVLETRRSQAMGTLDVHGYAGMGTRGVTDSLVLTEVAWDKEEFTRRMLDGELLFYTREQAPDEARRLHYLLIDASASM